MTDEEHKSETEHSKEEETSELKADGSVENKFEKRKSTAMEDDDDFDFAKDQQNNNHSRGSSSDQSIHTASPGRSHQSSTVQLATVNGDEKGDEKDDEKVAHEEDEEEEKQEQEQDEEKTEETVAESSNETGETLVTGDSENTETDLDQAVDQPPDQTPVLDSEQTSTDSGSKIDSSSITLPEQVPQRLSPTPPELPPRKRTPFFWLRGLSSSNSSSSSSPNNSALAKPARSGSTSSSPDYDLLLHRLNANKEGLKARDETEKDASLSAIRQLQENFQNVKHESSTAAIDWEFWTKVVNDYSNVAENQPVELSQAIAEGFPQELRGLIWQLIASSKSASLEEVYSCVLAEDSPHEKGIKRDLSRTSFIKNGNQDSLFNVIKAYSLFDPEVGYTQGMAFIVVPLLLNLTESEAFCLLVHLMKDYGLREMFLPEMPGLHVKLYQFDRIIEDTLPDVHIHLARQGVRSSMYASQWFLTLFAYKFPLPLVTRIFDIMVAEGLEALLRFGVALMRKNASTILSLEFDSVLPFLKERIFDHYMIEPATKSKEAEYSDNDLVHDAYDVKILPVTLKKYENEYAEIHRLERERVEEVESLRSTNGQLTMQVRRLEFSLAELNKEHVQVANEMVQGKLEIAHMQDENENMKGEIDEFKESTKDQSLLADKALREEMQQVTQENDTLKETKNRLETQLNNLEQELVDTKMQLANLDDSHSKLKTRWSELRKHIDGP